MKQPWFVSLLFCVAAGCGSDPEPSSPCAPAQVISCPCGDGREGTQTCRADGNGYDACGPCGTGEGGAASSTGGSGPTTSAGGMGGVGGSGGAGGGALPSAVELTSSNGRISNLAATDTHLYWTDVRTYAGAESVFRVDLGTLEAEVLATGVSIDVSWPPREAAIEENLGYYYWATTTGVDRVPLTGGAPELAAADPVLAFTVDQNRIRFISNLGPNGFLRQAPTGNPGSSIPMTAWEGNTLPEDDDYTYSVSFFSPYFLRCPRAIFVGCEELPGSPTDTPSGPTLLRHYDGALYWVNVGDHTVKTMPAGGGPATTLAQTSPDDTWPMFVVDASGGYLVQNDGVVRRVPLAGGGMGTTALASFAPGFVTSIATTTTHLYWSTYTPPKTRLYRLAK